MPRTVGRSPWLQVHKAPDLCRRLRGALGKEPGGLMVVRVGEWFEGGQDMHET